MTMKLFAWYEDFPDHVLEGATRTEGPNGWPHLIQFRAFPDTAECVEYEVEGVAVVFDWNPAAREERRALVDWLTQNGIPFNVSRV